MSNSILAAVESALSGIKPTDPPPPKPTFAELKRRLAKEVKTTKGQLGTIAELRRRDQELERKSGVNLRAERKAALNQAIATGDFAAAKRTAGDLRRDSIIEERNLRRVVRAERARLSYDYAAKLAPLFDQLLPAVESSIATIKSTVASIATTFGVQARIDPELLGSLERAVDGLRYAVSTPERRGVNILGLLEWLSLDSK